MMTEKIQVHQIVRDGGTQSRAALNEVKVAQYAEMKRDGVKFDPVGVVYDGEKYWLWDGFHRVAADIEVGNLTVDAEVTQGTQRDAILLSCGANGKHGLERSNADKRRAVETLLLDSEWVKWSNEEIARRCAVSAPTVRTVRSELVASLKISEIGERQVTRNGTTYIQSTGNIGTTRHWGLSNGMAFWEKVQHYRLDKSTVLDQLQPGATHLTDLAMERDEAFERLKELAKAHVASLYPVTAFVYHAGVGRIGRVTLYEASAVYVSDPTLPATQTVQAWQIDGVKLATQAQIDAYLHPPFPVGSKVLTDASDVVAEVIDLKVGEVCIRRKQDGGNQTNWVKVEHVRRAPDAAPEPELQVGDTVRTRTGRVGVISEINGALYYLDGGAQAHYREKLTKIDPLPEADDQATADELAIDEQIVEEQPDEPARGGWQKRLTPSGILMVSNATPDWDDLNWIGKWRAIRRVLCPNPADDPFLFILLQNEKYLTLGDDAEAVIGALGVHFCEYRQTAQGMVAIVKQQGFAELEQQGATGAICYMDMTVNLDLLNEAELKLPPLPWRVSESKEIVIAADGTSVLRCFFNGGLGFELAKYIVELVNQTEQVQA